MSRLIEELTKELRSKEALITELSGEKTTLTQRVGELEVQVQELSSSLLQKDKDVEVDTHFFFFLYSLSEVMLIVAESCLIIAMFSNQPASTCVFYQLVIPLFMYSECKTQPPAQFIHAF